MKKSNFRMMELQHPVEDNQNRELLPNGKIHNDSDQIQPQIYHEPEQHKEQEPLEVVRRRKRFRRRQVQENQANQFLKQPVVKINNLNKNLKRAYEKGFLDDSKFDFIRSLRKIRRHPEQDSVSSHYRSDDQSFDINDVLPKRGFQKKRIIAQNGDMLSSSNSQEPNEKKGRSNPRKPRKPKEPKEQKQPRQRKQPRQPKIKKQVNQEKQLKKQVKIQEKKTEPQHKQGPKKSGVQIKITKAPNQQARKLEKRANSDESRVQSQSQFNNSSGQISQEGKIEIKIRESQPAQPEIKTKYKQSELKKPNIKQNGRNLNQTSDKVRITVEQTQKIIGLPQKQQAVNVNITSPAPIVNNKFLPPNIVARKNEEPQKIDIKQLLPASKVQSSDNSSSSDSSSSSSSSSDSGSSSSGGQQGLKKNKKDKKKKKNRHQSSSSDDSSKHKKKKKKKARKHKHKMSQNPSESLITKLIKDDNLRKMLVKTKQKEAQLKLKQIQEKQKQQMANVQRKEGKLTNFQRKEDKLANVQRKADKLQNKKEEIQKPANQYSAIDKKKVNEQIPVEIQNQKLTKLQELKANKLQEQKKAGSKIRQAESKDLFAQKQRTKAAENKQELKKETSIQQKQAKSKANTLTTNTKNLKIQPLAAINTTTQTAVKQELNSNLPVARKLKKQIKPTLRNASEPTNDAQVAKPALQNHKTQKQTNKAGLNPKKPMLQNFVLKQEQNLKDKSKKLKNLTMEKKVVVLQLMVGNGQLESKDKKAPQHQKQVQKEKIFKQPKIQQRIQEKRVKQRQIVRQQQSDESSDSSSAKYYSHRRKHRQVPQKVMRYRKVIVERSQSQDTQSSDQYVKRRIVRVKREVYQSSSSSSEQAIDYRRVQRRKVQKNMSRQRK